MLVKRDESATDPFKFGMKPLFSPGIPGTEATGLNSTNPDTKLQRPSRKQFLPEPTGSKLALEKIKHNL